MKKLAIITTHPIQYYGPLFRLLAARKMISIKVYYTIGQENYGGYDHGFGKVISWDISLLEGYPFEWVENSAPHPGSHHAAGIVNPALITRIKLFQPDAVLVFGWAYRSHLKAMRYFKGKIPVYFRGDSTLLDNRGGLKNLLKNIYLNRVYKYIDHAFYVGTNNKAYFKKYGIKEQQLSFAPHAVDNERFAIDRATEAGMLRKTLKVKENEVLVLYAGKLEDKKAPLLLADAFIQMNRAGTHLLFLGNGVLEAELKAKSAANIHFMDFMNQQGMPVVYQACDLFCLPSKGPGESWGLAVNEAMACGKTVLVSDKVGCAADLVKSGFNGAVFKSGSMKELSRCLEDLTASKTLLHEYGINSRLTIKEWSFKNTAAVIENHLTNKR